MDNMNDIHPFLIIQMGYPPRSVSARVGSQEDWFMTALRDLKGPIQVVRPFEEEPLPAASRVRAAVITGSWSMVTDHEPWSERTADWVREAAATETPLLGVCYGHQLMAHALGGRVDYHPKGAEIGIQTVELLPDAFQDPLLQGLPLRFPANLSHRQAVLVPPNGAKVLARSAHDDNQVLRYGPRSWSVQFHPEFTPAIMAACIEAKADQYAKEGFNVRSLLSQLGPTPQALLVLRRFASIW